MAAITLRIQRPHLIILAVAIIVLGAGAGYVGANFDQGWVPFRDSTAFTSYLESEGIPPAGRTPFGQWLGDQWLESHSSYSGQDGKDWKVEAERRTSAAQQFALRELERKVECLEDKTSDRLFVSFGC